MAATQRQRKLLGLGMGQFAMGVLHQQLEWLAKGYGAFIGKQSPLYRAWAFRAFCPDLCKEVGLFDAEEARKSIGMGPQWFLVFLYALGLERSWLALALDGRA